MILVDLNQVLLSGLMAQIASEKKKKYDEDLIRHLILNILRNHIKNFKSEYGQVVLCCDNRNYWRKEVFPFYKAGRKKLREKSDLDWHMIFDILGKIKEELKLNFPYKVIDVDGAEADDIIGTLAPRYVMHENVLILSSDGDFLQLQQYNDKNSKFHIKQYNPAQKKFIKSDNPMMELKEKIIRGDKGDGIPNIYSPSDCFVRDLRQKPITKGVLAKLMNEDSEKWPEETLKIGFSRNKLLIDLREIPKDVKERIIVEYDNAKPAPKSKLFNYFIEKKLKNLMDVIEDY
jgi:5'-3' exonuclease